MQRIYIVIILAVLSLLIGHKDVLAQEPLQFTHLEYLTSDEGLSQSEVTCMLQDRKGFLWVGTRGGLNRFDGSEFKIFQNEIDNPNSLTNSSIESLFEDSRGLLWIGTKSGGASVYDPRKNKFQHFQYDINDPGTISSNRIISIAESATGEIWLGSWDKGISIISEDFSEIRRIEPTARVNQLFRSEDGKMWAAASTGLRIYAANGNLLEEHSPRTPAQFLSLVRDRRDGKFYLGTWTQGLFVFDPKTKTFDQYLFEHHQSELSINNFYSLYQDSEDKIWAGAWNGGLREFDPNSGELRLYDLAAKKKTGGKELYKDVLCIFEDRFGILWFGTNGGGLCKIDERVQQFSLQPSNLSGKNLPNEPVWSIIKDTEGVLWVGFKGINSLFYSKEGSDFHRLAITGGDRTSDNLQKKGVLSLYESQDGTLYAATIDGLYKVEKDAGEYRVSPINVALAEQSGAKRSLPQVTALFESTKGIFYLGQKQRGLKKSLSHGSPEKSTFTSYLPLSHPTFHNNRVTDILEDITGRLWIGTYGGLHLYRPSYDDFLHFGNERSEVSSLSSDIVICMHEDQKGNLWIGTPNGLNMAIPKLNQSFEFRVFQEKDGLPNNYIHAIEEDERGNLWISTNKGICKFNPEQGLFLNYDVQDGLPANAFMEKASFRDSAGVMYFGSINGLCVFHPDSIHEESNASAVVLTGLKIFNQEVLAGEIFNDRKILSEAIEYETAITLASHENVFSIDYTSLNFLPGAGKTYSYRMEGLEEDWNYVGNQKSVTYNNLRPGNYTFAVQVANNRGFQREKAAKLNIKILPPIFATTKAYVLYTLLFIGLLLLYRHFINRQNELRNSLELSRIERNQEVELTRLKTQFFTNIAHELRTPLTLISGPVEELINEDQVQGKARDYLFTVHHHAQRLLRLVSQLLDFRKAECGQMTLRTAEGNFVKFSQEVFLSFREMAAKKEVDYQIKVEQDVIPLYFDRDKMEIVLCNLLSNALKYVGKSGRVSLTLKTVQGEDKCDPRYCEICVEDNGPGMPAALAKKIFDRFYQIANSDSVKIVGTGIGLSLAKNIVELHQGNIEVFSQQGVGSKFIVRVPLGKTHLGKNQLLSNFRNSEDGSHYPWQKLEKPNKRIVNAVELDFPESNQGSAELNEILIVEDNLEIALFIQRIFSPTYKTYLASNGVEGVAMAIEHIPDLIVSDVMMPEMDGLTFCGEIKKNEKTAHIPVILLTARTATVFQVQGYDSGADAYVTKPFHPPILKAQVDNLITARRQLKAYFGKIVTLQPTEVEITSLDEQFLQKLISLIEENICNERLSRAHLAKTVNMSASSLYRKIKALTGMTTNAFIRSIRLKRAAQLIQSTQYNISEVAYQVGFNDLKYFRNCFKEQFGVNPSEFAENQDTREST